MFVSRNSNSLSKDHDLKNRENIRKLWSLSVVGSAIFILFKFTAIYLSKSNVEIISVTIHTLDSVRFEGKRKISFEIQIIRSKSLNVTNPTYERKA